MSDNRRTSYRVPFEADAQLFHKGNTFPCQILDMSAGGVRLAAKPDIETGESLGLGLHLLGELKTAAELDYLHFDLEVLSRGDELLAKGWREYRCRNMTVEGSPAYERASKLVFAAERQRRAEQTGAAQSSPMARPAGQDDDQPTAPERFSKGSVNPLHGEH